MTSSGSRLFQVIRDVLLLGHRQAFAWVDEWIGESAGSGLDIYISTFLFRVLLNFTRSSMLANVTLVFFNVYAVYFVLSIFSQMCILAAAVVFTV